MGKAFERLANRAQRHDRGRAGVNTMTLAMLAYILELQRTLEHICAGNGPVGIEGLLEEFKNLEEISERFMR